MRISHENEAANSWKSFSVPVHLYTLCPDFRGSAINIYDGHITIPPRPSLCVPNLFVQGHEARHCVSVCHQQRIINAFHTGALSGPADDFAVKFHSRGGVCRYQFVPDEPAMHVRDRKSTRLNSSH